MICPFAYKGKVNEIEYINITNVALLPLFLHTVLLPEGKKVPRKFFQEFIMEVRLIKKKPLCYKKKNAKNMQLAV